MIPLMLGPETRAEVERVRAHAEKQENWYHPGSGQGIPGDNPAFVAQLGLYRAVFTWTVGIEQVARHLSVSVGVPDRWPGKTAVWTIATMFGFTRGRIADSAPAPVTLEPGDDWQAGTVAPGVVVVIQPLPRAVAVELGWTPDAQEPTPARVRCACSCPDCRSGDCSLPACDVCGRCWACCSVSGGRPEDDA